ncbi:hypothetical protein AYO20_11402 [Fonsecaea nubica]|uniref:PDZ domain-containing protein n=1 Tax=Fonsecaea nubica TaxID=856822 RepID=A0A178BVT7_9EURO|nr:hypothetical protein AYO20_11402 [Fonsecaea nubica]OAL21284.1 hypothetical protein AYO20_11402 [Fonsecaea nubica]
MSLWSSMPNNGLTFPIRGKVNLLDELGVTVAEGKDVAARPAFLHPAHDVAVLKFDTTSVDKELLRPHARYRGTTIDPPSRNQKNGILLNEAGQILGPVDSIREITTCRSTGCGQHSSRFATAKKRICGFGTLMWIHARYLEPFRLRLFGENWEIRLNRAGKEVLLEADLLPFKQPLPGKEKRPLYLGDIILEVNGELVTEPTALGWQYEQASRHMLVLRDWPNARSRSPCFPPRA